VHPPNSAGDLAISVKGVSKRYMMYERPEHRLWQGLFRGRRQFYKDFWALQELSFDVARGETVGIIGRNGSGKSTLLQIICGTLTATTGAATVKGRLAALLELGAGFNHEFTGRENVFLNGTILGLTRQEVENRFDRIASFADIGQFIDQPVKTYSSGMVVRLAFAVVANVDAEVLVVDEALAVGDALFTQKCMRYLRGFQENGTILFVSHDTGAVLNLCNRALWLSEGRLMQSGPAKPVVQAYMRSNIETALRLQQIPVGSQSNRLAESLAAAERTTPFGAGGAAIESFTLFGENGGPVSAVRGGEAVTIRIRVSAERELSNAIVGFNLKDRLGQVLFGVNTYEVTEAEPVALGPGDIAVAEFRFQMPRLRSGKYSLDLAIAEGTQVQYVQHQWFYDAAVIEVVNDGPIVIGLFSLPSAVVRLTRQGASAARR
jgi:lipopolysaccharide transport system ATP-binding protein